MASFRVWLTGVVTIVLLLGGVFPPDLALAQGISSSPYSGPSILRRGGLGVAPPSLPGGGPSIQDSGSAYFSSGMLKDLLGPIPNLQFGYLYSWGNGLSTGRATVDYLLPIDLGSDSVVFGEAHGEFTNFWKTVQRLFRTSATGSFDTRTDISLGGGYRRLFNKKVLLGVNGFYDGIHLGETWHNSGGIGLEMAVLMAGYDAMDLNFNWYGNPFNANALANAFRKGPGNFDIEAGYSHELFHGGPDLRLFATGYKFTAGSAVYGWRAGGELKTRDGVFSVKYEAAHDRVNRTYHTVGGFVNVGFQPERLLAGESPFVMPEPIFKSPRNLRRWLSRPVKRNSNVVAFGPYYFVLELHPPKGTLSSTVWPVSLFAGTVGQVTFDKGFAYGNNAFTLSVGGDTSGLPPTINVTMTAETDSTGPGTGTYYFGPVPIELLWNVQLTAPSYSVTVPSTVTVVGGHRGVPYAFNPNVGPSPIVRTMRIIDNGGTVPELVIKGTFR